MKKIVLFIDKLYNGGAQRQMAIMANLFDEYGYKVSLVTCNEGEDDFELNPSVNRINLDRGKGRLSRWWNVFKYFNSTKFDCVISFIATKFLIASTFFRCNRKFKIIAGERAYSLEPKFVAREKRCMKWDYRFVDFIVPNSYAQCNFLVSLRPEWKDRIIAITNYTDVAKYTATPLPCNDIIRIGIFGRYSTDKNCLNVAKMVSILKDRVNKKFIIEWYGHNDTDYYKQVVQYAQDNNLQEYIHFNGFCKDVIGLMPKLDIIALPSKYEGFSNSIAEGICCGKPILASDIADNRTMVHDSINGFLFSPDDIEEMADKFSKMISMSHEQRQVMGNESRKIAESIFKKEEFIKKYVDLIEA